MTTGKKWISATAALCVGAIVVIATRQETGTPHDQVSGEDRRAIHTTTLSERNSNGSDQGSTAQNPVDAGLIDHPATLQAGNPESPYPGDVDAAGASNVAGDEGQVAFEKIRDEIPDLTTQASAASSPPGIQLAPEVRLPVAALPVDFVTNEVTKRMLDLIVTDYYRDLAAEVSQDEEETQSKRLTGDNGETTILVRNGPAAESARKRADWRFRTIFGKHAYNRLSMHSNLEARLPVSSPANGGE